MPYHLEGNCVKKADGTTVKCHDTHEQALAHLRALEANVSDAGKQYNKKGQLVEKKGTVFQQSQVNYVTLSPKTDEACANCIFYRSSGFDGIDWPHCAIVENWPEPIEPTGYCEEWRAKPPPPPPEPIPVVVVEPAEAELIVVDAAARKSFWGRMLEALVGVKEPTVFQGFKVLPNNRWVGWWTNNFEDLEGEIFTEKAIDDYIGRVKSGAVDYPELWFWHIPGTKHGKSDNLWRLGHFAVATGTFDDTPTAKSFQAYYKSVDQYGMSHGYFYPRSKKSGRVYNEFTTFELSPLRNKAAANDLTYWEVKSMQISDQAQKELVAALGESEAKALIQAAQERNKAAEATGRDHKGLDVPPDAEFESLKSQVSDLAKQVKALVDKQAATPAVEPVNTTTLLNDVLAKQAAIEKQMAEWTDLKPPGSKSGDTLLDAREKVVRAQAEEEAANQKSLVEMALEGAE